MITLWDLLLLHNFSKVTYVLTNIKSALFAEYEKWFIWLVVAFGTGVIVNFSLKFEPNLTYCLAASTAALIIALYTKLKSNPYAYATYFLLFIIAGFSSASLRIYMVDAPKITEQTPPLLLSGDVENIDNSKGFARVVLNNLRIDDLPPEQLPKKIRLNIRTKIKGELAPNARVLLTAKLYPPPNPNVVGGFNYAKWLYFRQIGATGHAMSRVKVLRTAPDQTHIATMRHNIKQNILGQLSPNHGAIANAMLTADKSFIDKNLYNNLRISGVAHLLAISGLHISLVAGFIFFVMRFGLSLVPALANHVNTKKLAAVTSILASFAYLLIAGFPVSATRAFIMIGLILLAILTDRAAQPLRSVAIAALFILITKPEAIMEPSMQMSFSAVIALLAVYDFASKYFIRIQKLEEPLWQKLLKNIVIIYPLSIALTTIVAGGATSIFAMYNFNSYAPYGLIANLVSVPLASFIIMPAGVMVLITMLFGGEQVFLNIMGWGISHIIDISQYVAGLEGAKQLVPQMSHIFLCIFAFGFLWLCLWRSKIRLVGIPILIAGYTWLWSNPQPHLIVSAKGNYVKLVEGKYYFNSYKNRRFVQDAQTSLGIQYKARLSKDKHIDINTLNFDANKGAHHYYVDGRVITVKDSIGKRNWLAK